MKRISNQFSWKISKMFYSACCCLKRFKKHGLLRALEIETSLHEMPVFKFSRLNWPYYIYREPHIFRPSVILDTEAIYLCNKCRLEHRLVIYPYITCLLRRVNRMWEPVVRHFRTGDVDVTWWQGILFVFLVPWNRLVDENLVPLSLYFISVVMKSS